MRSEEMISSERYCSSCGAANAQDAESCFACGLSLKITLPLPLEPISSNSQHLLQERYRILAQVGKGGFSAVYKGVDAGSAAAGRGGPGDRAYALLGP